MEKPVPVDTCRPVATSEHSRRWFGSRRVSALALAATAFTSSCATSGNGPAAVGPEVRVATWNVLFESNGDKAGKAEEIVNGAEQLFQDRNGGSVDVLMMQEVTKKAYRDAIEAKLVGCTTCTHEVYFADINHGSELPIAWDTADFKLNNPSKDTGNILTHGKFFPKDGGSGGTEINDRHVVWVVLEHIATHQKIRFVNTHILPDNQLADRKPYFNKHIKALRKLFEEWAKDDIPTILGGDFNVDFRKSEYQALFEQFGLTINWVERGFPPKGGTHDPDSDRVIDALMLENKGKLSLITTTKWSDTNGSDHRPVWGSYRFVQDDGSSTPEDGTQSAETKINRTSAVHIGDSIAVGLNATNTGISHEITDQLQIGASPKEVLDFIEATDVGGKEVVLSTGISNNSSQAGLIEDQLRTLKVKGAKRVLVAGTAKGGKYEALNDDVRTAIEIVNAMYPNFIQFMGGFTPSADKVHPKNYADYADNVVPLDQ